MKTRFIELIEAGGVSAVFSVGVDGFAQIHVALLKELLTEGGYRFQEVLREESE